MTAGEVRARALVAALLACPEGMTQRPLMRAIGLDPERQETAFRSAIAMAGEHVPAMYEDDGIGGNHPAALYRVCPDEWAMSGWCNVTFWNRARVADEDDGCYLPRASVRWDGGKMRVLA